MASCDIEEEALLARDLALDVCQTGLTPVQVLDLPADKRSAYLRVERRKLRTRLRTLQIVLGLIETLAAIAAFLLIYLLPVATNSYLACFYTLIGTPGIFLPLQLDLGCLSVFLLVTITLLVHGFVGRILITGLFFFEQYVSDITGGRYDNRFRWILRGAVYPAYYLVALHVSGARDFVTAAALCVLVFATEMFRWITERKRSYIYRKSGAYVQVRQSGRSAFYASVLFSGIVIGAQLAYWILYIVQDLSSVPLITWIYGIAFLVLYVAFSIWVWVVMSRVIWKYRERMDVEYGFEIYQTVALLILTGLAILGTVL